MDNESSELLRQILEENRAQTQLLARTGSATGAANDPVRRAAQETAEGLGQAEEAAEALAKAEKEAADAAQAYADAMKQSLRTLAGSLGSFGNALTNVTGQFGDLNEGLGGLGDAALDAGKALGGWGLALGLAIKGLTALTQAGAKQADASLKARDDLYKMGGAGAGTAEQVLNMGQKIGLTSKNLELFTKPLKEASTALAAMGGTVGEGVKKFGEIANVGKDVRMQYSRAGISQERLIEMQAQYVALQEKSGQSLRLQTKDAKTLQKESLAYVDNLMKLSALTGKSVEELQKEQNIAMEEFEEQAKTRQENAKIAQLRAQNRGAEADQLQQEQDARKQFIKRAYAEYGRETGSQMARLARTGAYDEFTAGLATLGVEAHKLKSDLKGLKPGQDVDRYFNKQYDGMQKAVDKQYTQLGDAMQFGGEKLAKTLGTSGELLSNLTRGYGKTAEERDRLAQEELDRAKGTGDAAASNRATLEETQRAAALAMDEFIQNFNPFMAKFGLLGVALGALTVAVGTATIALKGMSGGGIADRLRGAFGGGAATTGGGAGAGLPNIPVGGAAGAGGGAAAGAIGALAKFPGQALEGAAKGLMSFANPMVVAGAAGLGAAITAIGAGIAGAAWITGKALPTLADGLITFNDIDGGNLAKVGLGMGAVGVGLAAFGTGGAIAGVGNLVGGLFDKVGDKLGVDGPFKKLEDFSKMDIKADKVKANAEAFTAFGKAMAAQGGGAAAAGGGRLFGGLLDKLSDKLELKGPAERLKEFGDVKIDDKTAANVKRNAEVFSAFGEAMSKFKGGTNVGDALSSWAGKKLGTLPPMEQFQAFAKVKLTDDQVKQVKLNAEAFGSFSQAMSKFTGGGTSETMMGSMRQRAQRFFEAEPPMVKLARFANTKLTEDDVKQVKLNADAFASFSEAMSKFQGGGTSDTVAGSVAQLAERWFGAEPPTTKLEKFSKIKITEDGVKQVKLNADAFVAWSDAMSKFKGVPSTGMLEGAWDGLKNMVGAGSQDVLDKFKDFSKLDVDPDKTLKVAQAFANYASAMSSLADPKVSRGIRVAQQAKTAGVTPASVSVATTATKGSTPTATSAGGGGVAKPPAESAGGGGGGGGGILSGLFNMFGKKKEVEGPTDDVEGKIGGGGGGPDPVDATKAGAVAGAAHGPRKKTEGLIVHHTGGRGLQSAIDTLKARGLGYHYLVDRDGTVVNYVDDSQKAWHAGKTDKKPELGNRNSVGMALVAKDDKDLTKQQMMSAFALGQKIMGKYGISAVYGHGETSSHKSSQEGATIANALRSGTIQADAGGVVSGPDSGFPATLHGKEMIVPLQGDSLLEKLGKMSESQVKQDMSVGSEKMESAIQEMLAINQKMSQEWISKLDTMISVLENSRTTQEKTLRAVRT
jgi:N-acetylmuramoyl-L-alanine amidase